MGEFTAGQALIQTDKWKALLERLIKNHVDIPGFVFRAVNAKALDLVDKDVYLWNKRKVTFNKQVYNCFDDLVADYRGRKNPNYIGCETFKEEFETLVEKYIKQNILRQATEWEEKNCIINPANCVATKSNKFSLIIHTLDNARYSKPVNSLMDVLNRGEPIRKADSFMVEDLSSCYHQFGITKESSLRMGMRYNGKVYLWLTAGYGPSPAVYLVNTFVNLACLDCSLRAGTLVEGFIDDILILNYHPEVIDWLNEIGFILSPKKSQAGKVVEYVGLRLDAREKTIEILEKNYEKVKKIAEEDVLSDQQEIKNYFISFEALQRLLGVVVFCARTSPQGLTNAFHLMRTLAKGYQEPGAVIPIGQEVLDEIAFWKDTRHILKMQTLRTTGSTIKIIKQSEIKHAKFELKGCSDASTRMWCAKMNGISKFGKFPDWMTDEHISILEMFGLKECILMMDDGQEAIISVDNTNTHHAFQSKYSKNKIMNDLLNEIFTHMKNHQKIVKTRWISTKVMAGKHGADALSRGDTAECFDPNTLSGKGVQIIMEEHGQIEVDVFSSPRNNQFCTLYCSTFFDLRDPKCLQEEGLSFLSSRILKGTFWMWAPDDLTIPVAKIISTMNWSGENKVNKKLLFLVRQNRVKDVLAIIMTLKNEIHVSWSIFYKKNSVPKKIQAKIKSTLVLFVIGGKELIS